MMTKKMKTEIFTLSIHIIIIKVVAHIHYFKTIKIDTERQPAITHESLSRSLSLSQTRLSHRLSLSLARSFSRFPLSLSLYMYMYFLVHVYVFTHTYLRTHIHKCIYQEGSRYTLNAVQLFSFSVDGHMNNKTSICT